MRKVEHEKPFFFFFVFKSWFCLKVRAHAVAYFTTTRSRPFFVDCRFLRMVVSLFAPPVELCLDVLKVNKSGNVFVLSFLAFSFVQMSQMLLMSLLVHLFHFL